MVNYTKHILHNGLTVLTHEAADTPLATVNVLSNVGARDEDPGRTGFAHLFEHLMFSGTPQVPDFDAAVRRRLGELAALERGRCASLDEAAEPFAALLSEIAAVEPDETRQRILRQLFYHLGRWIYLIDAADDFAEDAKSGNYNPLRYRFAIDGDKLTGEAKRGLGETLDASIRRMADAYALLDAGEWTKVLDSVFYESFYAIGKAVLEGVYRKPSRLRQKTDTSEEPT